MQETPRSRRHLAPRSRRTVAILACVILAVLAVAGVRTIHGLRQLSAAANDVAAVRPQLADFQVASVTDVQQVGVQVARAKRELDGARRSLTPLIQLTPAVSWVPGIGPKIRAGYDALYLGRDLLGAGDDLLQAASALQAVAAAGGPVLKGDQLNESLLKATTTQRPRFVSAQQRLRRAERRLAGVDATALPARYHALVDVAADAIPSLRQASSLGLAFADNWRPLLGYEGPKTYLILAQNADELRATGGFVPGAWILTWDSGRLARLDFWDTLDLDPTINPPPLPPTGLLQALWAGAWYFRDSTWYPNFPTTAQVVQQFFRAGPKIEVDGVIGMDQWAVANLVTALGSFPLATGEVVSAQSYVPILEQNTDEFGRAFIDVILHGIFDKLRTEGDPAMMFSLLNALNKSLDSKDLLLSFGTPELATLAAANGWDGALQAAPGDYLMVVDSNVGFSKVNRNIKLGIDYEVQLESDGSAQGHLQLNYSNLSTPTPVGCVVQGTDASFDTYAHSKNACYWNYLRVYVPADGEFIASSPFPMPPGALYQRIGYADIKDTFQTYNEDGKRVFAGFFSVDPGSTRPVVYEYRVPRAVQATFAGEMYTLYLQKQPGVQGATAQVTIHAPLGYEVAVPSGDLGAAAATLTLSFALDQDQIITVRLLKA